MVEKVIFVDSKLNCGKTGICQKAKPDELFSA